MKKTNKALTKKCCQKNELPSWDLSDLYKSIDDKQIEKDLAEYKKSAISFAKKYKGKLEGLNAKQFFKMAEECEKRSVLGNKLGVYAYLNMVTQMKNAQAMTFYQNISEKLNDYSKPTIFLSLELNQLSEAKIKEWMQDSQASYFAPWLNRIRTFKDYELSEAVEEILHEKSVTSGEGWERLYEETSSRLKFVVDGKEYNDAEISKLTLEKDAKIREKAGREIARVYKENAPLFTLNYNMVVKDKSIEDIKRGFKSPVASQNLANRVDDKAVKSLAETVKENYADIAHRFYKLKAKWLGVKKLEYWDRNAPLPFESDKKYSWEEAVKTVLSSYNEFSPKLYNLAKDFFNKNNSWIDVPPRDGKRSGAFAMPLPDAYHPYLFLNFVGKQNDVLTLAHELGHGCHMRLSSKQGDLNDATPLTLAEVASVFTEMLTFQSLLKKAETNEEKLCLIAGKVNDMINTAIRQIAFHFFETRVHEERRKGEVSQERLAQIWREEMSSSLGKYVNIDEVTENNWAVVGHFFWKPFYVYAYSFADCLVNSLYQVYSEGKVKDFADKYLEMLSLTGVKKYDELLKPFGLNAKDAKFWNKGLSLISGYIDELERLDKIISKERKSA